MFCAIPAKVSGVGGATGAGVGRAAGRGVAARGVDLGAGGSVGTAVARGVGAGCGDAVARGVSVGRGDAVGRGDVVGRGVEVARGVELGSGVEVGRGESVARGSGVALGVEVGCGIAVARASGPRVGRATGVTTGCTGTVVAVATMSPFLFCSAERNAPIPNPATTTPIPSAIVGSKLELGGDRRGGVDRRRRGGSDIDDVRSETTGRLPASTGKSVVGMLRVAVPIDVSAVSRTASTAFALATPLRVGDVVAAGVIEALGSRAPQDKRERVLRSVLAGLASGTYAVEIDGRFYLDADDVVVCSGTVHLRFFLRHALRAA